MRALLDTQPKLVPPSIKAIIHDSGNSCLLSGASAWEVAIKIGIGKLALRVPFGQFIREYVASGRVSLLHPSIEHMNAVIDLPHHHRDPFDRMISAQATVEQLFAKTPGIAVASAGLNPDAENPLTSDLLEWADLVFVMEERHRRRPSKGFSPWLKDKRVISLDNPDDYEFMAPELVELLEKRVTGHLPQGGSRIQFNRNDEES